jgi:hypothetical protein
MGLIYDPGNMFHRSANANAGIFQRTAKQRVPRQKIAVAPPASDAGGEGSAGAVTWSGPPGQDHGCP